MQPNLKTTMALTQTHVGKQIQNTLIDNIGKPSQFSSAVAACARAWIDLERLKREMRGLPPLAPATLHELLAARRMKLKRITSKDIVEIGQPIELADTIKIKLDRKRIISEEQTVTTTPDPDQTGETVT